MSVRLSTVILLTTVLAACDQQPFSPHTSGAAAPESPAASVAPGGGGAVAVPFRARAVTRPESFVPDERCGAPPRFLNTQVGEGRGAHLGRFTVRFTFCVDATDLLDDGMLTEGESIPYDDGVGVIVAANGDELHLTTEGEIHPSARPGYAFEFQDPLVFTGGTGRFAGASGVAMTDSYVVPDPERTDHTWTGRLMLKRDRERTPREPRQPRR